MAIPNEKLQQVCILSSLALTPARFPLTMRAVAARNRAKVRVCAAAVGHRQVSDCVQAAGDSHVAVVFE